MKISPILFSTEMVKANLKGRKTLTRRIVNPQPGEGVIVKDSGFRRDYWLSKVQIESNPDRWEVTQLFKPKFYIGDILWVRESFLNIEKFRDFPLFKDHQGKFIYKADGANIGCHKWKPSIHMPKEAARIFLKVTNVRCEKLHDISEEDCIKEGIKMHYKGDKYQDIENGQIVDKRHKEDYFYFYPNKGDFRDNSYMPKSIFPKAPITSFYSLWVSINGQKSWDENPFVWIYEYERVEKPKNFLS